MSTRKRKKKGGHGGYREGAGRKPVLTKARPVLIRLEEKDYIGLAKAAASEGTPVAVYLRRVLSRHVRSRRMR